jgi:ferredoxin
MTRTQRIAVQPLPPPAAPPADGLFESIVASLHRVIPDVIVGTFVLGEDTLARVPLESRTLLMAYRDSSVIVYAVPITDEGLWVWHRHGTYRSLLANYVLLRAQEHVAETLPPGLTLVDLPALTNQRFSMTEAGVLAGLGTRGWNNLLLHPEYGSWVQIHAFALNRRLPASPQLADDVCIHCNRCVEACPVRALEPDSFHPARCSSVVASPWLARSRALALTANSYIECRECINACPVGTLPEGLLSWKR